MKKILTITLISIFTIMVSSGCKDSSSATPTEPISPKVRDAKISQEALYVEIHNNEKLLKVIKQAAKKTGWKITDFKSNEVLAEKTDEEDTVSSSVKFSNGYIEFSNNDATLELRNAVKELVNSGTTTH